MTGGSSAQPSKTGGPVLSQAQHRFLEPHLATWCLPKPQKPDEENVPIRHVHWQRDPDKELDALYYRAYFDNRPQVGSQSLVRVVGIVGHYKPLWCQVWYEGVSTPYVTVVDLQYSHPGNYTVHGQTYMRVMLNCELKIYSVPPTHVSIVSEKCKDSSILLPVHVSSPDQPLQEFLICMPTAYGKLDPHHFVEWVEFNRMMGVGEIWMYNSTTLHDNIRPVFDFYRDLGVLHTTAITNPWGHTNFSELTLTHPMALNDCLYQNIHRFKYIVELDVDEFIVPKLDDNWHDMLIRIQNKQRVAPELHGFHFNNAYFFKHNIKDKNEDGRFLSLGYRLRAVMKYRSMYKTIDTISRCVALAHHFCLPVIQVYKRVWVKEELAEKFHYRECPKNDFKNCTFPTIRETSIDPFKERLVQNSKTVWENTNIL